MSHHNPCRPHDCGCWCRNQQRQTAEVSPCELCSCGLCGAGKTEEIHKSKQIHSNTSRCLTTLKHNTSNLGFPVASKIPACYSGTAFQLNLFRRAASSADLLEMHYPASALFWSCIFLTSHWQSQAEQGLAPAVLAALLVCSMQGMSHEWEREQHGKWGHRLTPERNGCLQPAGVYFCFLNWNSSVGIKHVLNQAWIF